MSIGLSDATHQTLMRLYDTTQRLSIDEHV